MLCHSADEPWHRAPILSERAGQVKPRPEEEDRIGSVGAFQLDLEGRDRGEIELSIPPYGITLLIRSSSREPNSRFRFLG